MRTCYWFVVCLQNWMLENHILLKHHMNMNRHTDQNYCTKTRKRKTYKNVHSAHQPNHIILSDMISAKTAEFISITFCFSEQLDTVVNKKLNSSAKFGY